jgi:tRNA-modifying protein YgfZ
MTESCAVQLENRAVIALDGKDARSFLQGLITNDMDEVSPDRAIYAALLSPQGKYLFDFFLFEMGGRLVLECARPQAAGLMKRLSMYRLRADVAVTDTGDRYRLLALLGTGAAAACGLPAHEGAAVALGGGLAFVDPRTAAMGVRLCLPADADHPAPAGFEPADHDRYEAHRIRLGVPEGADELAEGRALPLEAGLDDLHAISFGKGCYVGQEVTARMKARKLVRNRLVPIRIEGTSPAPGTRLQLGETDAGEIRVVRDRAGIAMVKLEALERSLADNAPLTAGNSRVMPEKPGWARF